MKKIILASLLIGAMTAQAKEMDDKRGFYLAVPLGYGFTTQPSKQELGLYSGKFKKPFIFGLAGGYDFEVVRAELSWNNRSKMDFYSEGVDSDPNTGAVQTFNQKIKVNTFMVNVYKDFYLSEKVVPYVTAGLGVSKIKSGDVAYRIRFNNSGDTENLIGAGSSKNRFSWQLGLGLGYKVTSNVTCDVSYRYTYLGKVEGYDSLNEVKSSYKLKSNDVMFNIRVKL